MIEEDMDSELERLSIREGQSKAALIRRMVRSQIKALPPLSEDPIWRLVGSHSFEPGDVDDVVYR